MTNQERLAHYEKEKSDWLLKSYEFLNRRDYANHTATMEVAKRYDLLVQKIKKII